MNASNKAITFNIDIEAAVDDIMAMHLKMTEDNLLPSGDLNPSVNADLVAGLIGGQLFGLLSLLNTKKDHASFKELEAHIRKAIKDVQEWSAIVKNSRNKKHNNKSSRTPKGITKPIVSPNDSGYSF